MTLAASKSGNEITCPAFPGELQFALKRIPLGQLRQLNAGESQVAITAGIRCGSYFFTLRMADCNNPNSKQFTERIRVRKTRFGAENQYAVDSDGC